MTIKHLHIWIKDSQAIDYSKNKPFNVIDLKDGIIQWPLACRHVPMLDMYCECTFTDKRWQFMANVVVQITTFQKIVNNN